LPRINSFGNFQKSISQSAFAMVNVANYDEVPDIAAIIHSAIIIYK